MCISLTNYFPAYVYFMLADIESMTCVLELNFKTIIISTLDLHVRLLQEVRQCQCFKFKQLEHFSIAKFELIFVNYTNGKPRVLTQFVIYIAGE